MTEKKKNKDEEMIAAAKEKKERNVTNLHVTKLALKEH
jgi:hypothetical protein